MGELNYEDSWDSSKLDYFPKRRKWGRSFKAKGIQSLGRKPYTSFSSPEFSPLSPHIFTRMAEPQPIWQVLRHPPQLFPRRGVEYRYQNGPSGKYSRLPGSRANIEQLFLLKADIHFSFSIAHFICKNVRIILCLYCGPDSDGLARLTPGLQFESVLEDADET